MTAVPDQEGFGGLSEPEVRKRTAAGLFLTAGWSGINLLLGFAGNVALARLLVPQEFGVFAIGATVLLLVGALSDGGLSAGLLRRAEPPLRSELRNLVALHLVLTLPLAAVACAAAPLFGSTGWAVAIMLLALPVAAFQTPGRLMFNRELLFQQVSIADAVGTIAFYAWAIAGAALGYGVWALATAAVVRVLLGVMTVTILSPHGLLLPSFSGARRLLPLFGFGMRYQAAYISAVARDQVLAVVVAGIGGLAMLGLWSFIYRLMQGPLVFFQSVWRVSFPAMIRLLETGKDVAPVIERSLGVAATAAGIVLVGTGAAAPELVPGIFGEQWRNAAPIMTTACLALLLWGPVSVSTVGYLFAVGAPSVVVRGTVVLGVTWIGVTAALLPLVGVAALGLGWLAGGLADAAVVARATSARTGTRFLRPLAAPVLAGCGALAGGWAVTERGPDSILSALVGGGAAMTLFLGFLLVVRRDLVFSTFRFGREAVGSALGRRAATPAETPAPSSA